MRLIDADILVKQGYEIVVGGLQYGACNKSIDIDDIPTAYDIDKVVEELENNTHIYFNKNTNELVPLEEVIEIVKAGEKNDI